MRGLEASCVATSSEDANGDSVWAHADIDGCSQPKADTVVPRFALTEFDSDGRKPVAALSTYERTKSGSEVPNAVQFHLANDSKREWIGCLRKQACDFIRNRRISGVVIARNRRPSNFQIMAFGNSQSIE